MRLKNNNKRHVMHNSMISLLAFSIGSAFIVPSVFAADGGFIEDATATLQARNYYFSRDFSDIVGPNQQSKAEEWAQGFILKVNSGFTQGAVGFGVDAIGMLGFKLDSGGGRVNTGLLPTGSDGNAQDDYSRLGAALKVRLSQTELRIGELTPNLPVLAFSDIRLLPPTYQGLSVVSNDIAGLTLQAGQLRSGSLLNEAGDGEMFAKIGYTPLRGAGLSSDRFNYAGADYAFDDKRTSVGVWYAQLEDIYNQRFYSFKHSKPMGGWMIGANIGFFDSQEDGDRLLGNIDNQAAFSQISARHGGHTFMVGYQAMFGDDAFPRVFNNIAPLGNEVPTYEFAEKDERSWQARYDYDFAALGVPGLVATVRYMTSDNVDTGKAFEGKAHERDLDLGYTVQSGLFKNVGIRLRNVAARSNYRSDIDENRLILSYTHTLF